MSETIVVIESITPNVSVEVSKDQGPQGATGSTGATGPANTLSIGTVVGGVTAAATITGTAPTQTLNLTLPKGDTGSTGAAGTNGTNGAAATVAVGTVTTGSAGSSASVTNSGTTSAATLNFTIPRGDTGATGATGSSGVIAVTSPITNSGTSTSATLGINQSLLSIANTQVSGLGTASTKDIPATGDATTSQVVYGTDTRLTNSRTPSTHASSHASAGSDPITIAESQVTNLTTDLAAKAPLASPALTGTPTSTTAAVDTNTTQIATTAYVVGQGYLKSATASSTYAPIASPTFTGTATTPTLVANASITGSSATGAISYGTLGYSDTNHALTMQTSVNSYAQMEIQNTNAGTSASADVIVANNQTTASTFYGDFGINSSGFSGTGSLALPNATYVTATSGDLALGTTTANGIHFVVNGGATDALAISSTGIPSAATAAADTNTTQLATTAFVVGQASAATPLVNGTATVGTSLKYAREGHIHPTDTSRAPTASPTFTGTISTSGDILQTGGSPYATQPTPIAKSANATLLIADLLTGIITSTSTTAVALTLPTGTLMDGGVNASVYTNMSFDWSVINLGSSTGAVTMTAGTGHTYVGQAVVPISSSTVSGSARFRSRRTGANTWVTYRIS